MSSSERPALTAALRGRCFLHPVLDYLLIGGGLSLLVALPLLLTSREEAFASAAALPFIILFSNSAHFASSTVRLYTKPNAFQTLPFLTMGLPLVALAVVAVLIAFTREIGLHFQALYLTWSPYHYAAQAYGLTVMYSYRSGCQLQSADKKLLWWTAMVPFFYSFASGSNHGLGWLLPDPLLASTAVTSTLGALDRVFPLLAFGLPILLWIKIGRSKAGLMPLIGPLLLVTNALWWILFTAYDAFFMATIFHGLQYLVIVAIFDLKDQLARPDNHRSALFHVLTFYGRSLLLAYCLFHIVPLAFFGLGFGMVESVMLVVAAINVHHFVVDGYIWRLGRTDSNRRIVEGRATAPAVS